MIDLRSDTVTQPTPDMRRAMAEAEVGDDVYGEDPTIARLEELGADMMGKEAAVFVPSGTMGNQIAVLAQTTPGDEIILEAEAHVFYYEVGGLARLGGLQTRTVPGEHGRIRPEQVAAAVRDENIHFPRTTLLCLENTHNRAGGTVLTVEQTAALAAVAHEHGLNVHLDGARVFNAAVALGVPVADLAAPCDTVMFCLSKGLSAPVGSLVAGPAATIARVRQFRKLLGGGMRQAGVLAAAGLIALQHMPARLAEDHEHARRLALGLAELPGVQVDLETVQTNIVIFHLSGSVSGPALVSGLREHGVLANATGPKSVRFVTHKDITAADIDTTVQAVAGLLRAVA